MLSLKDLVPGKNDLSGIIYLSNTVACVYANKDHVWSLHNILSAHIKKQVQREQISKYHKLLQALIYCEHKRIYVPWKNELEINMT